jgi:gliding motility-associated-like protein
VQIKDKFFNTLSFVYLIWFGVLSPFVLCAQLSKQHYIPPVPDLIFETAFLYISTPHDNVQFTIKPVGQPSSSWVEGSLSNTNAFKIQVERSSIAADPWNYDPDHVFADKGFEILANREVYVSLRLRAQNHAGSLVSKGIDGLGKSFRVGGMERQQENDYSFFSILATKNNTLVDLHFDPSLRIFGSDAELPKTITLEKNETYTAVFNGVNNDLFIGSLIESQNNDVVVNSGSIIGSFSNQIVDSPDFYAGEEAIGYLMGSDMGIDQLISINDNVDATEYLLIKGDGFNSIENALVIANENNTLVYLNENNTPIRLEAGEHVFIEGDQFTEAPNSAMGYLYLQSNKNIYVFQGTGKKGTADGFLGEQQVHWYGANQGMFFVPPLSCTSVGDVESIGRINEVDEFSNFNGSLFVLSSYGSSVRVNGLDVSSIPGVVFEPGPIQTSASSYQIHRVDGLVGDVSIVGSEELYVSYYNVNDTATSGAFYSGFNLEPKVFSDLTLTSLGNCVDSSGETNVVLQLSNAENYDSFKWQKQKNDGTWLNLFSGLSSDSPEYAPNSFGTYRVEVVIDCLSPNSVVYSSAINVSICPIDSDQDGVVDNIDLDNDNDGIYDQIESLGDFEIDLTKNPPELVVDSSFPYSVPVLSRVLAEGNGSFTPFPDGRFTSFLPPKQSSDDEIRFELSPAVPKSIHLSFGFADDRTVPNQDNTYFSIESVDPSESITLLDPDGDVDILVDDSYLSGYTQYNSSKITFRLTTAAVGTTPSFRVFAAHSSGLVFTHHNDSSSDSVFEGEFSVYNLHSYSDNDDLSDAFDLDSDDDGCFDVIEAGFLDADNDGRVLQAPLTIDTNTVSHRGLVIEHSYDASPNDVDSNLVYDFQEIGSPAEISSNGNPVSVTLCAGDTASFSVDSPTEDAIFQWSIDGVIVNNLIAGNEGLYGYSYLEGLLTNTLSIRTDPLVDPNSMILNGAEIKVLISRPTYACPIASASGVVLNVLSVPETPVVDPIYTYCFGDSPTVLDLKSDMGGSVEVFLTETGGSPLSNDEGLIHDQTYFIEGVSADGCVSLSRAQTEVVISNPELVSSSTEICLGEGVTLSVNGVPQTAQDFAIANPDFELFLQYESSSYFLKRESMAWTEAYNLIQSLGAGASMYVINNQEEENAVYDALDALGIAGTESIHFWLGLRQLPSLNPNNQIDEGWQWLDGRLLTDDLANWSPGEPNDCCGSNTEDGEEDYAQFDFYYSKTWNDMTDNSPTDGDSWPVFEFTGTTEVVWGKINPSTGDDIVFEGVETSAITENPTETTTYFYEVTTNGVSCRVETTVVVNPLPEILAASDMILCDNDLDGDAFNGLVNGFDLQAQEQLILNGDPSLEVLFFVNETDTNAIDKTVLFGNSSNPQQLYYRVRDQNTGCESAQANSFALRVLPIPPTIEIDPHYECDDQASGSDLDTITTFNLQLNDSRIQTLLAGSTDQYHMSYHTTLSAAEDLSVQGITSYTMTPADNGKKTIYVRVIDAFTPLSCVSVNNRFDLVLTPLPVLDESEITFEQCDETDGLSDGIVLTNLRSFENVISANAANEEFTYYTSPNRSPASRINDPTSYYNADINGNPISNDIVYVQINSVLPNDVFAPNGSCVRDAEIYINVAVSQIKESFMLDFDACELPPSTAQDGRTRFPPTIFETLTTSLLREHPLFAAIGVEIRYFSSLADAAVKKNEIDQSIDYENPNPLPNGTNWVDEIWANVEVVGLNTITCIGLKKVANLYVERLPTAHAVPPFRACDDDGDGLFAFDTTRVYQQLTKGQTNIEVSYFDESYNLLFTGALPSSYESGHQKIIARVENNPSNNTPSCYEETEIEFIVDATPNFNPLPTQMLCDDADGILDGLATFDTQLLERDLLNGQTDVVVYYYDEQGNALPSPLPPQFNTPSTTIRVELVNSDNIHCVREGFIDFKVVENPSFDIDEQAVLCLNETVLDLQVKDPSDTYDYVWEYVDENNNITSVGASPQITISLGGTYRVTATTIGELGCSTTKSVEVITSELAKINANDVVVRGFSSQENTVEIRTDNLGAGNYEYALDDSFFQDDPYFEQVKPGIRTVKVRDKNGCGVATAQIGVVGYYKYFSPNNDGINDTWQILGLKTTFNSNSVVYIYDRYGRFLRQLSNADDFWDGTYQGQPLPADDYWFRLELEDGRILNGHFSLMR